MSIIVQKYGGSSLASKDKIEKVADNIQRVRSENQKLAVIVSAMGDTTDELIDMAHAITEDPEPRELDMLLNTGEQISISLLTMALQKRGIPAVSLTGSQLEVSTTERHQKARIKDINEQRVMEELDKDKVVVAAGFQGVTEEEEYTTLGRGGSDTTAVALAAKLEARCEIYTDVAGIHTCDPGLVSGAKKLSKISYEEMMEMASLGAEVIHPRAVELASKYEVPIYVGDAFEDKEGTEIGAESEFLEKSVITGMAISEDDVQVNLRGVKKRKDLLGKLFSLCGQADINIDMISQLLNAEDSMQLSFTVSENDRKTIAEIMETYGSDWQMSNWWINESVCKISVVGPGMRSQPGVAAEVFNLMQSEDIMIQMVTTSEIKISWLVDTEFKARAAELIAEKFDLVK